MVRYYIKIILKIILHFFHIFKIEKNQIFLLNELSFTYGDNLKYINEYIQQYRKKEYKIIFPLYTEEILLDCISVKPYTYKYFKYLLTSKIIITNCGGISYLPLRNKQICINTWHGGGPYKKTGNSAYNDKWYKKELILNKKNTRYMVSSCELCTNLEAKSMLFNKKDCILSGNPRIDVFFMKTNYIKEKVLNFYNIERTNKLVLFAPTYRTNSSKFKFDLSDNFNNLDYHLVLNTLQRKFGGTWQFAVRFHPKVKNTQILDSSIINCTAYPDMQELLYAADVVITDYSSLMWDFSFTKRPCFLFADDIDDYEKNRGFYLQSKYWPFPIAKNNIEIQNNILNFDHEIYIDKIDQHHSFCGSYEKGTACKQILELIEKEL